ncbi:hypothetical protein SAMN05444008_12713 [Cnuella takakiae]|uniref:Uncharacterized protein n=1 Tax=Cnuella takakiae TaxID=1302690 RepID=A0A1M5J1E9_9BACT|nr:hypothetical protein [Cnuella takakiae]OLY91338.1 hypothetical protein BUE76_05060 [Cnuella takakiae]SHG34376.1 hypothetical protein SAMN05444008_12713 [Cnuella takakiae]
MNDTPKNNTPVDTDKPAGMRIYASAAEQELDRLKEALRRTPEERFKFLMVLMRMQRTMQAARFINDK